MPFPGLIQLEATTVQDIVDGRPVKILAAYLSHSNPLIRADLTACFAKHKDLNSWQTLRRGYSCVYYATRTPISSFERTPQPPTHNLYTTPDVLDIVKAKDLRFPVCLTSCSALNSNHFPAFIDTGCCLYFQHPTDRWDFRSTD